MTVPRESVLAMGDIVEGRYRILRTLGVGGMGTVFLAEHALIKRRVALKVLHPELASRADVIERFMKEARAAGTLGHANIVESTDMGFVDGVPYIVFEYLEGVLLTDEIYRVCAAGEFPIRRAARIAQQIASALHAAHAASIIHRDLKSDNVFLTDAIEADHVKVLDFGISRFLEDEELTHPGMMMGTPEFMAPEQITGDSPVDRRTDVYALGVILYEMLAGRRPFRPGPEPDAFELLTRIVREPPPWIDREDLPGPLQQLVQRMLAKAPADRCASMAEVELALDAYAGPVEWPRRASLPSLIAPSEASRVSRLSMPGVAAVDPTVDSGGHAKLDTSDQLAGVAMPRSPSARPSWWLYAVAGAGVAVGAIGLTIGTRSEPPADSRSAEPAVRSADATPAAAKPVDPVVPSAAAPASATTNALVPPSTPAADSHASPSEPGPPALPIDQAMLTAQLRSHHADVERCVVDGRTSFPGLAGQILVVLWISSDGRVARVQTETAMDAPPVLDCVVSTAKQWSFPPHAGAAIATASFRFTVR